MLLRRIKVLTVSLEWTQLTMDSGYFMLIIIDRDKTTAMLSSVYIRTIPVYSKLCYKHCIIISNFYKIFTYSVESMWTKWFSHH